MLKKILVSKVHLAHFIFWTKIYRIIFLEQKRIIFPCKGQTRKDFLRTRFQKKDVWSNLTHDRTIIFSYSYEYSTH